jgi:hypothetical protein
MSSGVKVIVGGTGKYFGTYAGEFNPASGLPTTGSGTNGKILKGDYWKASGAGTIASLTPFTSMVAGDLLFAEINRAAVVGDFFAVSAAQLTIDTLNALYVALTGDQTIAGVKTFSSSPIVPTPTTATQAANKTYVDSVVVGLWDDRGNFDASVNAYPSSGGSGTAGAIMKGDIWTISVAGTLPTAQVVEVGDTVRALTDTPGNTQANWSILQNNIASTTVGANLITLPNPSALKLIRTKADNTVEVIDPNEFIGVACSDETTVMAAASTSVPVATFHAPYALTLTRVFAGLRTAGTGAAVVTVDIHVNGTTVMSATKILFTASQKLSADGVLTTTSIAAGDYVEIFLDQRDTDNVATGLKAYLVGYKT